MDYWSELSLPYEEREKRVRKEGDKAAAEALENLMQGKIEPKIDKEQKSTNADPQTLDRFLGLGLDPAMLGTIKPPHKKED